MLCIFHATLLLVVSYLLWNKSYSWGNENELLRKLYTFQEILNVNQPAGDEDVVLINVSFDKELVEVYDEYEIPMGTIDVTDRNKLYRLFDILGKESSYKYILCDISLNKKYVTGSDSLLENRIETMRKIRFAHVDDEGNPNGGTLATGKTSYVGYTKTFLVDDFFKYEFIHREQPTLAYDMWKDLTSGQIEKKGLTYKLNGKLAVNSVILSFPFIETRLYDEEGNKTIYNLGEDILNSMADEDIVALCKDRIVLIGSFFEQDIHTTVVGELPGVLINYNAYLALLNSDPRIPKLMLLLIFVVYLIMTSAIVFSKGLTDIIPDRLFKIDIRFIEIILTWFGYTFIMMLLCVLCYLFVGVYLDILIIASWFTLLETVFNILKSTRKLKTHKLI